MNRRYEEKKLLSLGPTQRVATARRFLNTVKSSATKDGMDEVKEFRRNLPFDLETLIPLAFMDFTRFKPEEQIEYIDQTLKSGNALEIAYTALDYLLKQPPIDYNRASRDLTRTVKDFHRQLAVLRDGPYLPRIADRTFQDLEEAFRNRGIPDPEPGNEDQANLLEMYSYLSIGLVQEVQEFGIKPLQGLSDFSQGVLTLLRYDQNAPQQLIGKFRNRKQELINSIEDDLWEYGNEIKRVRYFKSVSQAAKETLDTNLPSYLALAKAGIFQFLVDDIANGKDGEKAIDSLLESLWNLVSKEGEEFNLETLAGKDNKLGEIKGLVQATPNERRKEFYLLLQGNPEYLEFAQTAKRIDVTLRDYARFILDYAGTEVTAGEDTTAFGFIYTLANNPQQREVARLLIESDTDWTATAEHIYSLAQHTPESILLVRFYMGHILTGEDLQNGRARESFYKIPPDQRAILVGAIRSVPKGNYCSPSFLTVGDVFSSADASIIALEPRTTTGTTQKKYSTPPPKTTGYGIDEIADMDGIDSDLVREADFYLREIEGQGVWKELNGSVPQSVWQDVDTRTPENINRIARYITREFDSPHFQRVLGNPKLRTAYFSLFDRKPDPLDKIMRDLDPNDILYNILAHQRLTAKR